MSRRPASRPDLDRHATRYFVYRLLDGAGRALYVGRSCNVAARIRAHHSSATATFGPAFELAKREWFFDVRSVDMEGPFTWDAAVSVERRRIEQHQPRGNRAMTARDHRPGVAQRSASRAT